MRRHVPPIERAIALASDVLPTPGTSSMSRWPSANRHTSERWTARRLPRSTGLDLARQRVERVLERTVSGSGSDVHAMDLRPRAASVRGVPDRRQAADPRGGVGAHATVRGNAIRTARLSPSCPPRTASRTHDRAVWFRVVSAVAMRPRLWPTARPADQSARSPRVVATFAVPARAARRSTSRSGCETAYGPMPRTAPATSSRTSSGAGRCSGRAARLERTGRSSATRR